MRRHSISTICRKCLMLLALLLASIQMVYAQEEGGTTTTETKVYGEGDLIDTVYAGGSGTKDDPWLISTASNPQPPSKNDIELKEKEATQKKRLKEVKIATRRHKIPLPHNAT